MSCGVGRRRGLDLMWLWLWCRPAAVVPTRTLAWELPYATGEALKRQKKKKIVGQMLSVWQSSRGQHALSGSLTVGRQLIPFSTEQFHTCSVRRAGLGSGDTEKGVQVKGQRHGLKLEISAAQSWGWEAT